MQLDEAMVSLPSAQSKNVTVLQTNNTLLQQMLRDVPHAAAHTERISLSPGTWPAESGQGEAFAYFPDRSLISLSHESAETNDVSIAVVGCQGFWFPGMLQGQGLQAQVLHGGDVYRLDWRMVQADLHRYASWLVPTAGAAHRLMQQMAQMAFCAHHHSMTQRIASWLLVCLNQSKQSTLRIRLADMPASLRAPQALFEASLLVLEDHLGIHRVHGLPPLKGEDLMPAQLWTLDPHQLSGLACSCHRRINT